MNVLHYLFWGFRSHPPSFRSVVMLLLVGHTWRPLFGNSRGIFFVALWLAEAARWQPGALSLQVPAKRNFFPAEGLHVLKNLQPLVNTHFVQRKLVKIKLQFKDFCFKIPSFGIYIKYRKRVSWVTISGFGCTTHPASTRLLHTAAFLVSGLGRCEHVSGMSGL